MSKVEDPLKPLRLEDLDIGQIQQKHFAEPNGMLHTDYKDKTCYCTHKNSQHLNCDGICLQASSSEICICDSFRNGNMITSAWEDQSKIIKRKKQQAVKKKIDAAEDQHIFDYIHQISKI
jgi:hypothetical protein